VRRHPPHSNWPCPWPAMKATGHAKGSDWKVSVLTPSNGPCLAKNGTSRSRPRTRPLAPHPHVLRFSLSFVCVFQMGGPEANRKQPRREKVCAPPPTPPPLTSPLPPSLHSICSPGQSRSYGALRAPRRSGRGEGWEALGRERPLEERPQYVLVGRMCKSISSQAPSL